MVKSDEVIDMTVAKEGVANRHQKAIAEALGASEIEQNALGAVFLSKEKGRIVKGTPAAVKFKGKVEHYPRRFLSLISKYLVKKRWKLALALSAPLGL